jgi:hypothetical protein
MFLWTNNSFSSPCGYPMREESTPAAPPEWGAALVFSSSCNDKEEYHASTDE